MNRRVDSEPSGKARVALLTHSLRLGGIGRVYMNLAEALNERGCSVDLVVPVAKGEYAASITHSGRVVEIGMPSWHGFRDALGRYLVSDRPVVMLCASDFLNVLALWARQRSGAQVRIVTSTHAHLSVRRPHIRNFKIRFVLPSLMRWFYRKADAVVAVSNCVADDLARVARLPRERITVIHNPVVTDNLFSLAKALPNHPWFTSKDVPVILAAGRLAKEKNYPLLLRAFALFRRRRPARLIILGDGGGRPGLEALARELNIADDLVMPGFVDNPYAYIARADLLVLSSTSEAFGNVLVEAMACGCPVVATDCPGGVREILENGRYGRLVPVADHRALARAMAETLDEPPDPRLLKTRAMDFHVDKIIDQYSHVLGT